MLHGHIVRPYDALSFSFFFFVENSTLEQIHFKYIRSWYQISFFKANYIWRIDYETAAFLIVTNFSLKNIVIKFRLLGFVTKVCS